MKKVIRTKSNVNFGPLGNLSGIVHMRIASKVFNDVLERVEVNNQYYWMDGDTPRIVNAEQTIIPYLHLDLMIQQLLDDNKNKINSDIIEEAFLIGAMAIIEQKGILGTTASDWEFYDVSDKPSHTQPIIY